MNSPYIGNTAEQSILIPDFSARRPWL